MVDANWTNHLSEIFTDKEYKKKLNDTLKKVIEAQKKFENCEKLLKEKEAALQEKNKEISDSYKVLNNEKQKLEERLVNFLKESQELEKRKFNILNEEKLFKQAVDKEKLLLSEIRKKTEENYKNSEDLVKKNLCDQETIKKAQEKLKMENKIIADQLSSLSSKRDYFEKMELEIQTTKKASDDEKQKILAEREQIQNLKEKLAEERNVLRKEIKEAEIARNHYQENIKELDSQINLSIPTEFGDMNLLIENLMNQITIYNNEISIRESILIEKEQKMKEDSLIITKNIENQKTIKDSLTSLKEELQNMSKEIIPELEKMYKSLQIQVSEVFSKKIEAENICEKLTNDVDLLLEVKILAAKHQEKLEKHLEDLKTKEKNIQEISLALEEKRPNRSFSSDSKKENAMNGLEHNLELLKEKESEIDKESEKNSQIAEYLKASIQEIEETKSLIQKEKSVIREKSKKIEAQNRLLNEKEKELETLRKNLEFKATELRIKEKEINLEKLRQQSRLISPIKTLQS